MECKISSKDREYLRELASKQAEYAALPIMKEREENWFRLNDGKGAKHRVVPLPRALESRLKDHLAKESKKHADDLAGGCGDVHMPEALMRKYPNASKEWPWQFLFPSASLCQHPRTGSTRTCRP